MKGVSYSAMLSHPVTPCHTLSRPVTPSTDSVVGQVEIFMRCPMPVLLITSTCSCSTQQQLATAVVLNCSPAAPGSGQHGCSKGRTLRARRWRPRTLCCKQNGWMADGSFRMLAAIWCNSSDCCLRPGLPLPIPLPISSRTKGVVQ